jgi:isopentenyl diphosphate isomerase/L-lactate dehydrogenase-like FMN-dependent dehydrogenase
MRPPTQVRSYFTHETSRYVNKDRAVTKRIVQQAERRGIKALFITVDAPQLGRREKVGSSFVELEMRELKRENRICA